MTTLVKMKTEEWFTSRVHDIIINSYADTPITMTRNAAIKDAQRAGCDAILMIDSDMKPDCMLGVDADAVPFMETAVGHIYDHYDEGPRFVAAPYCGSPPYENIFAFQWSRHANLGNEASFELRQYNREEAIYMSGIQEAAAAATGLILYDIRCFDNLIKPPYFRYEWTDETESKKASTEDVQNTRDISLAGIRQLGYNPCRIAWSSWAGHIKNWVVKKPQIYTSEMVSENLADALTRPNPREFGKKVQVENLIGGEVERLLNMRNGYAIPQPTGAARVSASHEVGSVGAEIHATDGVQVHGEEEAIH